MPDSVVSVFSDPDDFCAALGADGVLALLTTAPGEFRARLTRVSLNGLHLASAEERLPRIAFVSVPADTVLILLATSNMPTPSCGGIGTRGDELLVLSSGEECHARTEGAAYWGIVRVPLGKLVETAVILTGTAAFLPPGVRRYRPAVASYRRLRSLHAAAVRLADKRPQALVDRGAAHGLEQQLLHAVVECLSHGPADQELQSALFNRQTMARFERLLRAGQGKAVSVTEVCEALCVSTWRLRRLCAEQLGLSPSAYDRLRRLSRVRRALLSDPSVESVTEAARNNGFRALDRFSRNYLALFGISPSAAFDRNRDMRHLPSDDSGARIRSTNR